jgi:hypothetical protein
MQLRHQLYQPGHLLFYSLPVCCGCSAAGMGHGRHLPGPVSRWSCAYLSLLPRSLLIGLCPLPGSAGALAKRLAGDARHPGARSLNRMHNIAKIPGRKNEEP